jgi:hypothetical protein
MSLSDQVNRLNANNVFIALMLVVGGFIVWVFVGWQFAVLYAALLFCFLLYSRSQQRKKGS